jgi:lipopolysaccharide/colanic/teichoic acid biosynthesis glycosyltransferase
MNTLYPRYVKRMLDLFLSLILFMVLSPLFILLWILLACMGMGSPLFMQRRPGKDGKLFTILKFKTMNDARDTSGALLGDEARLTGLGKVIRSCSLDEIPQLINVIKGDMSLIGPRPLLEEYLPHYTAFQKRRHEVRPGITGWAQVNGRNTISWDQKFSMDVWYVDHCSLRMDLAIIFLTIKKVFVGEGIHSRTSVTMEKFTQTLN